jgi:hypothetical protein
MSTRLAHQGLDKSLKTLRHTLRKLYLTANDRPIARRNARRRVLAALRKMREVVDESFPAIVERSAPRVRKSPEQRVKALQAAGWVRVSSIADGYAVTGVPAKVIKWREVQELSTPPTYVKRKGWVNGATKTTITHVVRLIPAWAAAIGPDKPSELRAAKKSITLRKAALVAEALS